MSLLILSETDVKQCITMPQAITVMEQAFKEFYANQTILPLRTSLPVAKEDAVMLTMPAYLNHQNALGLKVVSVFPNNKTKNLPAINGVVLLLNAQTGEPQALMDAGYLTALRTGAVSGLATQYLAKKDAKHLALIGAGAQALTQLEAVAAIRPIERVTIWSRNFENALEFAKQIDNRFEVQCFHTLKETIKEADIICTATASTEPLIHWADLTAEVHINAVGSHNHHMVEIANDVMAKATVVVDQLEAALAESGEVFSSVQSHVLRVEDIIELGKLLSQPLPIHSKQITVFKSVGLAIQDISIAQAIYTNALLNGVGSVM